MRSADDGGPTWAPLRPADTRAWADLVNTLAVADQTEEFYDAEDLAEELDATGFDPATDSWAVWDGDVVVGYGTVRVSDGPDAEGYVRVQLEGGVRPSHRGRGIGRALMDRLETRASELSAHRHPGVPARLRCVGGVDGASVRDLLAARGYAPARWFSQMTRALPLPTDAARAVPGLPDGVRLTAPDPDLVEPLWRAHGRAFADHWGSTPISAGRWAEMMRSRSARPAVSSVAVDAAGAPLAYVLVGQWVDREAYITLVGTDPEHRGRGLASACLDRTVRAASDSGAFDVIELHVDSASPTGADRLYERVGFTRTRLLATYQRDLHPASGTLSG